jgi:hypothetical protein
MDVPDLGQLELEEETGWHYSSPIEMQPLPGRPRRFVFDDFVDEADLLEQVAVAFRFRDADPSVIRSGTEWVHAYYLDIVRSGQDGGYQVEPASMTAAEEVWNHVTFPNDIHVSRDDDNRLFIDLECECSWEPEHGLQLVLEGGTRVTKVSEYDGHLTNAHALARPDLEGLVYVPIGFAS